MKKTLLVFLSFAFLLSLSACADKKEEKVEEEIAIVDENKEDSLTMRLLINDVEVPVTWEDNDSVKEIMNDCQLNDIVVEMSMYGGNEQFGSLGKTYTSNDTQTTTDNGDIVLYTSDNIVVFYGSNSWSYTRLGKMNLEKNKVRELLANGDVTLTLTK